MYEMTELRIDEMNSPGLWSALAPDGVTPSGELNLSTDATRFRFGSERLSGRLSGTVNAQQHRVQRSLANLNLSEFDELRFWLWSDRMADGTPGHPFFLAAYLGSAALPIGSAGNTWTRSLPVQQTRTWELVRLSLDDLPAAVRSAANLLQLRCIDAATSFTCNLDDLLAVREQMITDIEVALLARLHNQFSVNGLMVAAMVYHPENQPAVSMPYIHIRQYDLRYAGERTPVVQSRTDYANSSFLLRPVSVAYDVFYALDVFAQSRTEKTQIMEFILRQFAPRSELLVTGVLLTLEWVAIEPFDQNGQLHSDRYHMHFKVSTRQEVGPAQRVRPPSTVVVEVKPA
jgi:hypothetical protein